MKGALKRKQMEVSDTDGYPIPLKTDARFREGRYVIEADAHGATLTAPTTTTASLWPTDLPA